MAECVRWGASSANRARDGREADSSRNLTGGEPRREGLKRSDKRLRGRLTNCLSVRGDIGGESTRKITANGGFLNPRSARPAGRAAGRACQKLGQRARTVKRERKQREKRRRFVEKAAVPLPKKGPKLSAAPRYSAVTQFSSPMAVKIAKKE